MRAIASICLTLLACLAVVGCSDHKSSAMTENEARGQSTDLSVQKAANELAAAGSVADEGARPKDVAVPASPDSGRKLYSGASLTRQEGKTFVTQRAVNWCIPASIENCLRYYGINDVSQEKIIVAFCRMYGGNSLGAWARAAQPVSVRDLSDEQILAAAKPDFFTNGNFNTFARAAASAADLRKHGLEFEFVPPTKFELFMEKLRGAIDNDCPVLMAFQVGRRAYHIVLILGYDERGVLAFNPASGKTGTIVFSKFSPSHDGLILKPIRKGR
jgi:hypothetical protein